MTVYKEDYRVINTNSLGKCPKCGSENIEYRERKDHDETIGYAFKCKDCGADGMEWYSMEYAESEYYKERIL